MLTRRMVRGVRGALTALGRRCVAVAPLAQAGYARARGAVVRALEPELGQSMVEYALVIGLVALVAMVGLQLLGTGINSIFSNILAKVQGVGR